MAVAKSIDNKILHLEYPHLPMGRKPVGIDVLVAPIKLELDRGHYANIHSRRYRLALLLDTDERMYNAELEKSGRCMYRESWRIGKCNECL